MTGPRVLPAPRTSEREWQAQVVAEAKRFGWLVYHSWTSLNSAKGFPDLVLCHPRHGVVFAELKTATGKVTKEQQDWLDTLSMAGARAYVWRPGDAYAVWTLIATGRWPS